jgi:chromosomal replication initiation ATPase DnaA
MRQIALPLDQLRPGASASLIITDANAPIIAALGDAAHWPGRCAILVGPARSGKTLIGRYFETRCNGVVIDDAEQCTQERIFNAWNRAQGQNEGEGAPLLLLSRFAPSDWQISLPDLRSRIGSALLIELPPPDDELIQQLLQKHLADRGTAIGIDALAYVCRRVERSHAALEGFAKAANGLALAEGGAINLALVKRILADKV